VIARELLSTNFWIQSSGQNFKTDMPKCVHDEAIRKRLLLLQSHTTSITWALKAASSIQVKLQSTIAMVVVLDFSRSRNNTQESNALDVQELEEADLEETTYALKFVNYHFDEDIIFHAVIDLLHRAFQKGLHLDFLLIIHCTGRVDEILNAASSLDMFGEIKLGGDSDISHRGFWSISAAMEFNKRLTKLDMDYMEMTRQQAAALGAGLVTFNSQHFKELRMESVTFADGAITELASGLKHNSSLCILRVQSCHLGDVELAELVDAVESHPSLKELSMWGNNGQKYALIALGKVLASSKCRLEELNFSSQCTNGNGLTGHLGILAQGFLQGNKSLTHLDLSESGLVDKDMDHLGQILATCQLEKLDLRENKITHSGFVSLTQNIPKSLKEFDFRGNDFNNNEEAACHTLTLFEEHPQLWSCHIGFHWVDSKSPIEQKIQHFKDLNRCGRILLAGDGGARISLSVWPIVLARVNRVMHFSKERTRNAIFHLLQGLTLMQRRFDRDSSQATCVGAGASERLTTSSKRGPAETTDQASAKKGRSEY
jgi:hypothetical protein